MIFEDRFTFMEQHRVKTIDEIPRRMHSGNYITWTTDFSVEEHGWRVCFEERKPEDAPFTIHGNCEVREGKCLSSSSYGTGLYSNNEDCFITMLVDAEVSVGRNFSIETGHDHLIIEGVEITRREEIPRTLNAGATISWSTDSSIVSEGWELCLSVTAQETIDLGNFEQNWISFFEFI